MVHRIIPSVNPNHYENMPIQIYWQFYHQIMKIFRQKSPIFFIFLLKNIDCGYSLEPPRRGGSNEYPQSMFLSRNKENNVYPCKPQFYYIKVGFKGVKNYIGMFSWWIQPAGRPTTHDYPINSYIQRVWILTSIQPWWWWHVWNMWLLPIQYIFIRKIGLDKPYLSVPQNI